MEEDARFFAARVALEDRIRRGYTGAVSADEAFTVDIVNEFVAAARAPLEEALVAARKMLATLSFDMGEENYETAVDVYRILDRATWAVDEAQTEPVCGECGEYRPDDERVKAGMKCGRCTYAPEVE